MKASPYREVLPYSTLQLPLRSGTYGGAPQRIGMLVWETGYPSLQALLREDPRSLREVKNVATHQVRTFCYQKCCVKYRQVLETPRRRDMEEAPRGGEAPSRFGHPDRCPLQPPREKVVVRAPKRGPLGVVLNKRQRESDFAKVPANPKGRGNLKMGVGGGSRRQRTRERPKTAGRHNV